MLDKTSPAKTETQGVYKKLSAEEAARMRSESRQKWRMDYNSSIYGARRIGRQEVRLEVARNALREKIPFEVIAEVTSLPLEEVQQLAASLND
ncbi:MAG: hypothetical protein LBU79_09230 [Planctomycetota bacterium]|jgi:predicted transposase YdaD|nr:hypothetical protein [Planctomycetota bacterium]